MTIENRTTDRSISRAVKRVLKAQATQDGAGVSLYHAIGHSSLRELDPFLLFDEMHSEIPEQKRDNPAGVIPSVALKNGGFIKVVAGEGIADQPGPVVREDIGLVFLDVFLPPNARLTQPLPKEHAVFAYVVDGEVEFGCGSHNSPALVRERTVAVFDEGDHVSAITDNSTARFLLIAGRPIKESIVRKGPFARRYGPGFS